MKEIPILFSGPMVQAILEGRKTMTRRIVKPQPIDNTEIDGNLFYGDKGYVKVDGHLNWPQQFAYEFARWQPGDILWVRETWNHDDAYFYYKASPSTLPGYMQLGINSGELSFSDCEWKPSIHMPKSACRIYLQVEDVRVERLQDISEADAISEGIEYIKPGWKDYTGICPVPFGVPQQSFASLWQSINGAESWNANPWTWRISFKVLSTTGRPEILAKEAATS